MDVNQTQLCRYCMLMMSGNISCATMEPQEITRRV